MHDRLGLSLSTGADVRGEETEAKIRSIRSIKKKRSCSWQQPKYEKNTKPVAVVKDSWAKTNRGIPSPSVSLLWSSERAEPSLLRDIIGLRKES